MVNKSANDDLPEARSNNEVIVIAVGTSDKFQHGTEPEREADDSPAEWAQANKAITNVKRQAMEFAGFAEIFPAARHPLKGLKDCGIRLIKEQIPLRLEAVQLSFIRSDLYIAAGGLRE